MRTLFLAEQIARFWRYTLVGGAAAVVDVGGLVILEPFLPLPVAAATSFLIAMVFNFVLSAAFAFAMPATVVRFIAFAAAAFVGLLINVSITVALVERVDFAPALAKICGIAVAFGFNFAVNSLVVFRKR